MDRLFLQGVLCLSCFSIFSTSSSKTNHKKSLVRNASLCLLILSFLHPDISPMCRMLRLVLWCISVGNTDFRLKMHC
ncbi:hypothetical protein RIR_jg20072.t1 [Rhizophagus irregularis DAOM 181602=DAOM 197198]|nr:hypothetical protein RhiirB3_74865 [Rhizophagus irregularis]GET59062.1 hypothetical protein RIR_jg20072.t1 [Rhizophagus irregularis DAOM 181602=DAOM 197198]